MSGAHRSPGRAVNCAGTANGGRLGGRGIAGHAPAASVAALFPPGSVPSRSMPGSVPRRLDAPSLAIFFMLDVFLLDVLLLQRALVASFVNIPALLRSSGPDRNRNDWKRQGRVAIVAGIRQALRL